MIAAACSQIVEDLSNYKLYPSAGTSQSNIKPLTIVIEKQVKYLKYLEGGIQYEVRSCYISDLLLGDKVTVKEEEKPIKYNNENESTYNISGKTAFSIWNLIPAWMSSASATAGMSMKIKTDDFKLRYVTESAFDTALKGRSIDKSNKLIKRYLNLPYHRICVVTEVLETTGDTVIECTNKQEKHAKVSAEMEGQSVSGTVSNERSNTKTSTLTAGHVVGFQWTPIDIEGDNGDNISISSKGFIDHTKLKIQRAAPDFLPTQSNGQEIEKEEDSDEAEEEEESDDDEKSNEADDDWRLSELSRAMDGNVIDLKAAVFIIMHSPTDIEELSYLCACESGEKEEFFGQLAKKDEVLQILRLLGFEYDDNLIRITSTGPFKTLIPVLLEALSFLSSEELELIGKYDADQRAEILRIIKEAKNDKTTIPIDSEFTEDLKEGSLKNALAVMNFDINFEKREVSTPLETTCQFDAMWIILNCL